MYKERLKSYLQRINCQAPKLLSNGFTLCVIQECASETKTYVFKNYEEFKDLFDCIDCCVDKLKYIDTIVGTNNHPFIWSME